MVRKMITVDMAEMFDWRCAGESGVHRDAWWGNSMFAFAFAFARRRSRALDSSEPTRATTEANSSRH